MGWSLDDHQEDFTIAKLQRVFSLERLNPSPASVDFGKLDYFQGKHMRQLSAREVAAGIKPYLQDTGLDPDDATLLRIVPLIQERLTTFEDAHKWAGFFFSPNVYPDPADLVAKKLSRSESLDALQHVYASLDTLSSLEHEIVEQTLRSLSDKLEIKLGQLLSPVRAAVSGQRVSPPLFETLEILGKQVALRRIENATKLLKDL